MIPKNILHQYKTNIQKHLIDGYQVKSKKIKREIRLIGIVINWMTVDDFINKVKIRNKHLDFCINKDYKPDSIRKEVFKNPEWVSWFLNDEKIWVMTLYDFIRYDLISNEKILLLQTNLENCSCSRRYKKTSGEYKWKTTKSLVEERQINIYFDYCHAKDQTCIILSNTYDSEVCTSMLMDE